MNPEFERNLILEFSVARLIGMPLFLMVIFAFVSLLDEGHVGESTATAALLLYIFIVLFWGARQTGESLFDEVRNHTWDIQKTSAISPWSLAWGKLFGSSAFNWYGGFLCLIVYSAATSKPEFVGLVWINALSSGLIMQCLSLLISLLSLRCKQTANLVTNYGWIILLSFFLPALLFDDFNHHSETLNWYNSAYRSDLFIASSLWLACAWLVVAVYRLLAEALQIRTLPWLWLGFVAFLVIYLNGFLTSLSTTRAQAFGLMESTFVVCLPLTYLLILVDDNNPMAVRRLWIYSRQEQWQRVLEELPCWAICLILLIIPTLYLTLLHTPEKMDSLTLHPIPLFLLLLRDVSLILFFNYAENAKRAMGLSLLYLTFLYWILPVIFMELDSQLLAAVFLPLLTDNLALAIIFAAAQTGFIGFLVFQRWQSRVNHLA
jgi:hypothetical protein